MFKNYYKKLRLEENASEDEIKRAYKKLALKYHPDRHTSSNETEKLKAEEEFKEIAEAYEILINKDKYKKNNFNNIHTTRGFVNPHEIFNQIFKDVNLGEYSNQFNIQSNIRINIPQSTQNNCVIRSTSVKIINGKRIETIHENVNGITREKTFVTDLNNNSQISDNINNIIFNL
tara:strand:+ start:375 stop:899 length:525 start_codon:yes stop_codon:yes gene_type:complete